MGQQVTFSRPQALSEKITEQQIKAFDCGKDALNDWLKNRAFRNENLGGSRTYVSFASDGRLAGFFSLSNAVIRHEQLSSAKRRNQPDPVPCCLLGRLAVDKAFQGRKLGGALLLEAVRLTRKIALISGCWALIVQPKTDKEIAFYEHFGFRRCRLTAEVPLMFYEMHCC